MKHLDKAEHIKEVNAFIQAKNQNSRAKDFVFFGITMPEYYEDLRQKCIQDPQFFASLKQVEQERQSDLSL